MIRKQGIMRYRSVIGTLVILCFAVGCDSGPVIAPVSGVVKVDGKPLETGTIMFHPTSGRPAVANIDKQGRYELQTYEPGDGALLGNYKVTVEAFFTKNAPPTPTSLEDEASMPVQRGPRPVTISLVPEDYGDETATPLKATVEDKDNEINFEIPAP